MDNLENMTEEELEVYYIKQHDREEGNKFAENLLQKVNCSDNDFIDGVIEGIVYRGHRYLQNELFLTVIIPLLREWENAKKSNRFDERNKFTVEQSGKLMDFLRENFGSIFDRK